MAAPLPLLPLPVFLLTEDPEMSTYSAWTIALMLLLSVAAHLLACVGLVALDLRGQKDGQP